MIEHKFTPKTLGFDVLKETFEPKDLIGIDYNSRVFSEDKVEEIYKNIRNSPRIKGTCFIFKDTLEGVLNRMSDKERLKRAKEIAQEMSNPKNFLIDQAPNGEYRAHSNLKRVVELEKELRKLGY